MSILRLETANQFSSDDVVTSAELNALATTAKFVTGSSGATDDARLTVNSDGRLTIKADTGVTATELSMMNSSTGAFTLTGTAPSVTFDDSDNSGTSPIISSDSADGDLSIIAGKANAETIIQTGNGSGTATTRLQIGEQVSKDASNTSSQAGIKVTGDIYATADISADGDVAASLSSDIRLKENVTPIKDALDKVNQLSGNTFKWKDCATYNGDDIGVIAQEVQGVIPSAVKERYDGYLKVDYSRIVPLLLESIKELSKKVEILESKAHTHGIQ